MPHDPTNLQSLLIAGKGCTQRVHLREGCGCFGFLLLVCAFQSTVGSDDDRWSDRGLEKMCVREGVRE